MTIYGSCGHALASDDDGTLISFREFDCDPVEGYGPVVLTGTYCRDCVTHYEADPTVLFTEEEEDAWLAMSDEEASEWYRINVPEPISLSELYHSCRPGQTSLHG